MSNQGKAYVLTDAAAKHCQAFMQARADRMRWEDKEKYREAQEEAYALSTPVPTAQEMLDRIKAMVGTGQYPTFLDLLDAAAAEMGLTIDKEQGNA